MDRTLSAAGVTALLFVLALCSADAAVIEIKMAQIAFTPAQVSAHIGDTVEWTNEDICGPHRDCPKRGLGSDDRTQ